VRTITSVHYRGAMLTSVVLALALTQAGCGGSDDGDQSGTAERAGATTSVPAAAHVGDLPAALDNGAAGRNTYSSPTHVPPAQACDDQVKATRRSLVVRVLPDGPRAPDGALAFTSGVCVYLPPGYVRSGQHYPVVYLLHGGGGDAGDAVTMGHLRELMDGLIADDPHSAALVVMPDGTNGQWYDSMGGRIETERYVIDSVVPYVDQHFRTTATRRGRAVTGVSNGGYGAMLFAAKHPDLFVAAGGMSSNLDALTLAGLGPAGGEYYQANHPVELAHQLANTDVILDIASRCTNPDPAALCGTQVVDQAFLGANRAFAAALKADRGRRTVVDYTEVDGAHQWSSWSEQLRDQQLPFLLARLSNPTRAG
jgi:putative tributyrin esterase